MIEPHTHGPDGEVVIIEPSPEAEEVAAIEEVASAEVEIARIEGDTAVQLAKIAAKAEEATEDSRVAQLEAELRGMKEMLTRLLPPEPAPVPEVAPEPIVVNDVQVESDPEVSPPPEHEEEPLARKPAKPRGLGLW